MKVNDLSALNNIKQQRYKRNEGQQKNKCNIQMTVCVDVNI